MSQLIIDMHNVRSRDQFPSSRTNEWVYPLGESLLLDGALNCRPLEKELFDDKCPPEKDDTAESLANRLTNCKMFDEIYVHVTLEEETLN
jgi:hypothetical protein